MRCWHSLKKQPSLNFKVLRWFVSLLILVFFARLMQGPNRWNEWLQLGFQEPVILETATPSEESIKIPPATIPSPTPTNWLTTGWGKQNTGDYEGAVQWFKAQSLANSSDLSLKEAWIQSLLFLAHYQMNRGEILDALKSLEEASLLGSKVAKQLLYSWNLKQGSQFVTRELAMDLFESSKDIKYLKEILENSLKWDDLQQAERDLFKLREFLQSKILLSPNEDFAAEAAAIAEYDSLLNLKTKIFKSLQKQELNYVTLFVPPGFDEASVAKITLEIETLWPKLFLMLGEPSRDVRWDLKLIPAADFTRDTGMAPWVGGLFNGSIKIPVPLDKPVEDDWFKIKTALRHELTHAYLHSFCGFQIPTWLNEGLAQYFEGKNVSQSLFFLRQTGGVDSQASFTDPEILEQEPVLWSDPQKVSTYYASAFLLSASLLEPQKQSLLMDVLQSSCKNKESWKTTLGRAYGTSLPSEIWNGLKQSWATYLK